MKSKIFAVATFAFAMAFAVSAGAVGASEIYTPASGFLKVGSGMGTMAYQAPNVVAAQKALNECNANNHFTSSPVLNLDGKFGALTKGYFVSFQLSQNIAGDGVIGPVTAGKLAACSGTSTPTTPTTSTTLEGGAGDATFTDSNTGVLNTVKEGENNVKVMAFKVEADGSDIALTNLKVTLNKSAGTASTRLDRYLTDVSVWMGSKKVGSDDVSDFSKDGTDYSKTISLSNAVIKDGEKVTFYVAVSGKDTISTDDQDATWDLAINTARYNDATGAILSQTDPVTTQSFGFDAASADDTMSVTASTSNPQAANLMVNTGSTSNAYLVSAFKLKTGSDAGDIQINELPVAVTVAGGGNNLDAADGLIDSVTLKIDGTTYESDSDTGTVSNGNGTQTYNFVFDEGDVVVAGDSSTEVKVYVKFNDQKSGNTDNYNASGTTIYTTVTGGNIDAESVSNGDAITVTSGSTSKTHSVSVNAPTISLVGTPTFTLFHADDTASDVYLAKFVFNVTAGDDDIYLSSNPADITKTQLGTGTINSVTLDSEDGTLQDNSSDFLITSGDTQKFTLSYFVEGNNASDKITVTAFTYGLTDLAADKTVTTGLSTFKTSTVYLAE